MIQFPDELLTNKIETLKNSIKGFLIQNELWHDCFFYSYQEHVDGEPSDYPVVLILNSDGLFNDFISGEFYHETLEEEFNNLINQQGFFFETASGGSCHFYVLDDEKLERAYANYFKWRWICGLIQPDCSDVYQEIYAHFARRPEDLYKLDWRKYETLLFRVFQNQGFEAQLGPGRGDDGVDIKLLHRDPLGDILSYVQVKKYAPHRQIDLTAVQALYGAVRAEEADRGIFITTSSYAPVARRFGSRTSDYLQLKTNDDVQEWCKAAEEAVIEDKTRLISEAEVSKTLFDLFKQRDHRLVRATGGYNTVRNNFAIVIKETKHAALLMALKNEVVSHDGYGQRGYEIPELNEVSIRNFKPNLVWRAKRKVNGSDVNYWDGKELYLPWKGKPLLFDHCD